MAPLSFSRFVPVISIILVLVTFSLLVKKGQSWPLAPESLDKILGDMDLEIDPDLLEDVDLINSKLPKNLRNIMNFPASPVANFSRVFDKILDRYGIHQSHSQGHDSHAISSADVARPLDVAEERKLLSLCAALVSNWINSKAAAAAMPAPAPSSTSSAQPPLIFINLPPSTTNATKELPPTNSNTNTTATPTAVLSPHSANLTSEVTTVCPPGTVTVAPSPTPSTTINLTPGNAL